MEAVPAGLLVKAVVLNGRVVLDVPLAVPDGTLVTVRQYEYGDMPGEDTDRPTVPNLVRDLLVTADRTDVRLRALENAAKRKSGPEAA
jgi:hypothetical protein